MFSLGFLFGQRWSPSHLSSDQGPQRIRMMVTPQTEEIKEGPLTFYRTLEEEKGRSLIEDRKKDRVEEKKERKEGMIQPQVTRPLYSVQVGSYSRMEEANSQVEALKKDGFSDIYIMVAKSEGKGKLYRVRLGRFGGREDAQRMAEKIKYNTRRDAIVVRYEKGGKE